MKLRDVMGGAATVSAAFWSGVADAMQPGPQAPPAEPERAQPEAGRQPGGDARSVHADPGTERQRAADDEDIADRDDAVPEREPAEAQLSEPAQSSADGVLVPLDTWTRILDQLGNLHQAGQDLAEARERAARAETQAEFLRQQLAEAKAKVKARPQPAPKPEAVAAPVAPAVSPTDPVVDLRSPRTRITRARNRVGTWIRVD